MKLDKSYKVRVTPLKSARIQHIGFKCGFNWFGQKTEDINSIKSEFLALTKDGVFCVFGSEAEFENSANEEIEYYDLIALLTELSKSAENPLQGVELTPEFEAAEPKFKVGDKVYYGIRHHIFHIKTIQGDFCTFTNGIKCCGLTNLCHATLENYERLQATFPNIKFEAPPKPLTGSDLCRAIKAKGKKFIICAVSDISEEDAINNYLNGDEEMDVIFEIDDELDHPFIAIWGNLYKFAVPLSEETGEPLTESVLDE